MTDKPSVSGEMRAVQDQLQDRSAPRPSRLAPIVESRWTPTAIAVVAAVTTLTDALPGLVHQLRDKQAVVECEANQERLERRIEKLERRLKKGHHAR